MATMPAIFERVLEVDDPTVDRAMAAALATAGPEDAKLLTMSLIQRGRIEGTLPLVLQHHLLPPAAQAVVAAHADELARPIRRAASMKQSHGPANAVAIVGDGKAASLAYLVVEQLRHGTDESRNHAAACLLAMTAAPAASAAAGTAAAKRLTGEDADFLRSALEESVALYGGHRRAAVIRAVLRFLPRPMPQVRRVLARHGHPAIDPVRTMLRDADDAAARQAALLMLGVTTLADAALQGMRRSVGDGKLEDVLRHWPILRTRGVARRLGEATDPAALLPKTRHVAHLATPASLGLPAWLAALPLPMAQRVVRLAALAEHADPATRLAALRQLLQAARDSTHAADPPAQTPPAEGKDGKDDKDGKDGRDGPDAREADDDATPRLPTRPLPAIACFVHDPDPGIARIAVQALIHHRVPDVMRMLTQLSGSPHPQIASLAQQQLARLGFTSLWAGWPRMDAARRIAAGKALIKIDPRFHQHLAARLADARRDARLRALDIVHTLNQGEYFEKELVQLAASDDRHTAATAVRALATAQTAVAAERLAAALNHDDSRVRANAVEALDESGLAVEAGCLDKVAAMAEDDDNRPRANAILSLLRVDPPRAVTSLRTMLADGRAAHRVSGLWVVEHLELLAVAAEVRRIASQDPDRQVRDRARRLWQQLRDASKRLADAPADPPDEAPAKEAA